MEPPSPVYEEIGRSEEEESGTDGMDEDNNLYYDSQASVRPKVKDSASRVKTQRRKGEKHEKDSSSEGSSPSDSGSGKRQRDKDGFKLLIQ